MKLALGTLTALAALIAVNTAHADEHVCIGAFEMKQAWGKYPKSISLGDCILSNLPRAEFNKIVDACGHPYDTTHREPDFLSPLRHMAEIATIGIFLAETNNALACPNNCYTWIFNPKLTNLQRQ
jgi:hypothetical protein